MATYLEAAQLILKESGKPMSAKEIALSVIERGLIIPGGPTPDRSMGSLIYVDIKKHGEQSRFVQVGRNQFMLRDLNQSDSVPNQVADLSPLIITQLVKNDSNNKDLIPIQPIDAHLRKGNNGLSFQEAAFAVLTEKGQPMSAEEITLTAIEKGLISSIGKTPTATMNSRIYVEMQEHGDSSVFIKVARGVFFLRKNALGIVPSANPSLKKEPISQNIRKRRRKTKQLSDKLNLHIQALLREIDTICSFLAGHLEHHPTDERLCDWVHLCYTVEMFSEGRDLFALVNPDAVPIWYLEKTKKLARLCSLKVSNYV